ncbi:conserved hypothetical protein [Paecilomyces variotii No. 5]|uniref:alpha-galactosidase n=1 Tax=Byssochlamys spectabilis (strain No. 5 / NBRC 109023) TaxID=1356009 RepID=V5G7X0_BYSSN|nr:conserved hypothetical protein [Paecilomyces variotii No. 5]
MHIPRDAAAAALNVISITTTPNGFTGPARGWNSFGLQSNPKAAPGFTFNQDGITKQCDAMASSLGSSNGYVYCSIDSNWSVGGNGDEYGRIIPDTSVFPNITQLADHLHSQRQKLGVYVVPGGFEADINKTILGTDVKIGDVCSGDNGMARCNWDFSQDAVQTWHDSVVSQFAEWGVDLIKLDYVTPGSPSNGANLPADNSGEVIAYHKAIQKSGRSMRLDISWKLDRSSKYFSIWESNADSMRTDQDINNSGSSTLVSWEVVQRAIENYRQYIVEEGPSSPLSIYPDMDNLYVGNAESVSGISDAQRQSVMSHWIGASANLIIGSDLTNLDSTGKSILTDADALSIADFTAQYPMQPRNPGTGESNATQLQAWIAGPAPSGSKEAVVILANYGPDQGQGGFGTSLSGTQNVVATWPDLGLSGSYSVTDVWGKKDLGVQSSQVSAQLNEGESVLLKLTPA